VVSFTFRPLYPRERAPGTFSRMALLHEVSINRNKCTVDRKKMKLHYFMVGKTAGRFLFSEKSLLRPVTEKVYYFPKRFTEKLRQLSLYKTRICYIYRTIHSHSAVDVICFEFKTQLVPFPVISFIFVSLRIFSKCLFLRFF
jgi:hypothetical protein